MTHTQTLAEKYAEYCANAMDIGDLIQFVIDDIQYKCEQLSHEDLLSEIEQFAPEILKAQND
jgi:hypothetical protein